MKRSQLSVALMYLSHETCRDDHSWHASFSWTVPTGQSPKAFFPSKVQVRAQLTCIPHMTGDGLIVALMRNFHEGCWVSRCSQAHQPASCAFTHNYFSSITPSIRQYKSRPSVALAYARPTPSHPICSKAATSKDWSPFLPNTVYSHLTYKTKQFPSSKNTGNYRISRRILKRIFGPKQLQSSLNVELNLMLTLKQASRMYR